MPPPRMARGISTSPKKINDSSVELIGMNPVKPAATLALTFAIPINQHT